MTFFEELFDAVKDGAVNLAKAELANLQAEAETDAEAFLTSSRSDLERWKDLLVAQSITKREFADLLEARLTLAKMAALTETGIALARLDRFKAGLAQLVVSSAFQAIGV